MKKPRYKTDQLVQVLCHNSAKGSSEWLPGKVIDVVAAVDIDYRIEVEVNGAALTGHAAAHPDCVRTVKK